MSYVKPLGPEVDYTVTKEPIPEYARLGLK